MGSVFDIDVTQPQLKSARIVASIGKQMSACLAQHVWMSVG
jgi:hypothetical protein